MTPSVADPGYSAAELLRHQKRIDEEEAALKAWQDAEEIASEAAAVAHETRLHYREAKGEAMRSAALRDRLWEEYETASRAVERMKPKQNWSTGYPYIDEEAK